MNHDYRGMETMHAAMGRGGGGESGFINPDVCSLAKGWEWKKKKKEKSGERIQVFQVTSGLRGGWWRCYFALLAGGGMVEGRFEDEIRDAWNKNSFFFFFTRDWRSERARVIGDCFIPVDTRGRVGECIVLGCFWSHGWK